MIGMFAHMMRPQNVSQWQQRFDDFEGPMSGTDLNAFSSDLNRLSQNLGGEGGGLTGAVANMMHQHKVNKAHGALADAGAEVDPADQGGLGSLVKAGFKGMVGLPIGGK